MVTPPVARPTGPKALFPRVFCSLRAYHRYPSGRWVLPGRWLAGRRRRMARPAALFARAPRASGLERVSVCRGGGARVTPPETAPLFYVVFRRRRSFARADRTGIQSRRGRLRQPGAAVLSLLRRPVGRAP